MQNTNTCTEASVMLCLQSTNINIFNPGFFYKSLHKDSKVYVTDMLGFSIDLKLKGTKWVHKTEQYTYEFERADYIKDIVKEGFVALTPEEVHNYNELKEYMQQLNDGLCTVTECVFKCFEYGWHIQTIGVNGTTLIRDNPDGSITNIVGNQLRQQQTLFIQL